MLMLLLMLALVGFIVYLIVNYIPMPDLFQKAIIVIAIILVLMYLIRLFNFDLPITR